MSRGLNRALTVVSDRRGRPQRFHSRGRRFLVRELLDEWEEAGCWWRGEEARRVYRALTQTGAVYELHHQPVAADDGWRIARVFD